MVEIYVLPHPEYEDENMDEELDLLSLNETLTGAGHRYAFLVGGFPARGSGMLALSRVLHQQFAATVHGVSLGGLSEDSPRADALGIIELVQAEFLERWELWQRQRPGTERTSFPTTCRGKVIVVGMSLGALAVAEVCRCHPEKVAAVILISPAFVFPLSVVHSLKGIVETTRSEDRQEVVLATFPQRKSKGKRKWNKLSYLRFPLEMAEGLIRCQENAATVIRHGLDIPMLVIHSPHDRIVPLGSMRNEVFVDDRKRARLWIKEDETVSHVFVSGPGFSTASKRVVRWLSKRVWGE